MIVLLAVRLPAPLKEGLAAQLLPTVGAGEVLRVPGFAQCCEHLQGGRGSECSPRGCCELRGERHQDGGGGAHLASDGLVAGGTDAGGGGCDAQLLQVPGKAAQHVVQRGLGLPWHPKSLPHSH